MIRQMIDSAAAIANALQRLDAVLRTWAIAGLSLLALALVLAGLMLLSD